MPQNKNQEILKKKSKFITRGDFGIYDQRLIPMTSDMGRRPDGTYRYRSGDTRTINGDQARFDEFAQTKLSGDISDFGLSVKRPETFTSVEGRGLQADNETVGDRDSHNAKIARQRLAERALKHKSNANESAARGKIIRRNALTGLGSAAVMLADNARNQPSSSEEINNFYADYGKTALGGSNGSYPSQGPISKAMKIKNNKAGM